MMIPLYSALILFILLVVYKFAFLDSKYKSNKKTKEKNDKIYEAALTFITLFVTIYSIWLGEKQSERRPLLEISIDCNEFNTPNSSGEGDLYNYCIYLTNTGEIDAKVIHTELDISTNHISRSEFNDIQITIPVGGTQRIFKEDGKTMRNQNFLISKYYISYTSGNGNGDVLDGDTIYCKQ